MLTHRLWSGMSPLLAHEILVSTQKANSKLYRTAVEIMTPAMGVRTNKIMEMPKVERHAMFAQLLSRAESETLSFNLLSQWLVRDHAPLLCAWLDALGIEHDGEGCAETFPPSPAKAKLSKAVDRLLAGFDPSLVIIYLTTFNEIDEVQWEPLAELLKDDPRLKLVPAEGSADAVRAAQAVAE